MSNLSKVVPERAEPTMKKAGTLVLRPDWVVNEPVGAEERR